MSTHDNNTPEDPTPCPSPHTHAAMSIPRGPHKASMHPSKLLCDAICQPTAPCTSNVRWLKRKPVAVGASSEQLRSSQYSACCPPSQSCRGHRQVPCHQARQLAQLRQGSELTGVHLWLRGAGHTCNSKQAVRKLCMATTCDISFAVLSLDATCQEQFSMDGRTTVRRPCVHMPQKV